MDLDSYVDDMRSAASYCRSISSDNEPDYIHRTMIDLVRSVEDFISAYDAGEFDPPEDDDYDPDYGVSDEDDSDSEEEENWDVVTPDGTYHDVKLFGKTIFSFKKRR